MSEQLELEFVEFVAVPKLTRLPGGAVRVDMERVEMEDEWPTSKVMKYLKCSRNLALDLWKVHGVLKARRVGKPGCARGRVWFNARSVVEWRRKQGEEA